MSTRSEAGQWFFGGFLVLGAAIAGAAAFGFDRYVSVSGKPWSDWMSFGVYMQMIFAGAVVSALGFFVGAWFYHVTISRKRAAFAGALCCAVLCGALAVTGVLGIQGFDDSIRAYILAAAAFLAGFALAALSNRFLVDGKSKVTRG